MIFLEKVDIKNFFEKASKSSQGVRVLIGGDVGSGKTFFLKEIIKVSKLKGQKIVVIDQTGEYDNLINLLGGTVINMGEKIPSNFINPFSITLPFPEIELVESKCLEVIEFLQVIAGEFSYIQFSIIASLLKKIYKKSYSPLFKDFLDELLKYETENKYISTPIDDIRDKILQYYNNNSIEIFNGATNITSEIISFNLSGVSEALKTLCQYGIFCWYKSTFINSGDSEEKVLIIDEYLNFAKNKIVADIISSINGYSRKANVKNFISFIPGDSLLKENNFLQICQNASHFIFFKTSKLNSDFWGLNKLQTNTIAKLHRGNAFVTEYGTKYKIS